MVTKPADLEDFSRARTKPPASERCVMAPCSRAACWHPWAEHVNNGRCTAPDCGCQGYAPPEQPRYSYKCLGCSAVVAAVDSSSHRCGAPPEQPAPSEPPIWTCPHCRCDVQGTWHNLGEREWFTPSRGPCHESSCWLHESDDDAPPEQPARGDGVRRVVNEENFEGECVVVDDRVILFNAGPQRDADIEFILRHRWVGKRVRVTLVEVLEDDHV